MRGHKHSEPDVAPPSVQRFCWSQSPACDAEPCKPLWVAQHGLLACLLSSHASCHLTVCGTGCKALQNGLAVKATQPWGRCEEEGPVPAWRSSRQRPTAR